MQRSWRILSQLQWAHHTGREHKHAPEPRVFPCAPDFVAGEVVGLRDERVELAIVSPVSMQAMRQASTAGPLANRSRYEHSLLEPTAISGALRPLERRDPLRLTSALVARGQLDMAARDPSAADAMANGNHATTSQPREPALPV